MFCTTCGAENAATANFCGECGHPLAAATAPTPPPVPPPPATPPPAAPPAGPPPAGPPAIALRAPQLSNVDLTKLLAGDWVGSGLTALATLGSAFVLAVLALLLMHPDGIGVHQFLASATIITAAAFGGDLAVEQGGDALGIGYYPLTITFVALGVAALLLHRQLSRYDDLLGAIGHVVRSAVLLGAGLTVLTLALRTDIDVPSTFAVVGVSDLDGGEGGGLGIDSDFGMRTVGVVLLAPLFMSLIGAWLITGRAEWMHWQVVRVRGWIRQPLMAFGVVLAGISALGVVGSVILLATNDHTHNPTTIALWLLSLPNIGIVALGLGAGAPFTLDTDTNYRFVDETTTKHYLAHYADHITGWMWVLPVGTALVLTASALLVARRSSPSELPADLLRWVGVTTVLLPVLAHFGAYQVHFDSGGKKHDFVDVYSGIDPWTLLGLALAWTFAIAVVVAAIGRAQAARSAAPPPPAGPPPPPLPPPPPAPPSAPLSGPPPTQPLRSQPESPPESPPQP